MATMSGNILFATTDRIGDHLGPLNLLVDRLADRFLPKANATACHGGAPQNGCSITGQCDTGLTCQYCSYDPARGASFWSWAYMYRVYYDDANGYCNQSCVQCGLDTCFGGTYNTPC
jgi:hypothetical protein